MYSFACSTIRPWRIGFPWSWHTCRERCTMISSDIHVFGIAKRSLSWGFIQFYELWAIFLVSPIKSHKVDMQYSNGACTVHHPLIYTNFRRWKLSSQPEDYHEYLRGLLFWCLRRVHFIFVKYLIMSRFRLGDSRKFVLIFRKYFIYFIQSGLRLHRNYEELGCKPWQKKLEIIIISLARWTSRDIGRFVYRWKAGGGLGNFPVHWRRCSLSNFSCLLICSGGILCRWQFLENLLLNSEDFYGMRIDDAPSLTR